MTSEKVAAHWNKQPCNSGDGGDYPEGTLEWFDRIAAKRYSGYGSFIHQFANFGGWAGEKVLDVGCGVGTDLVQFAWGGAEVTGVDLSEHSADLARQNLKVHGLTGSVYCLNVEDAMALPRNRFDLVYSMGVIHHSPNPPTVINAIRRVLCPGGEFRGMLYQKYGLLSLAFYGQDVKKYHNPFVSVDTVYSRSVESPGTKVYSVSELRQLFSRFADVEVTGCNIADEILVANSPKLSLFRPIMKHYPRSLASWMLVKARKA